MNIEFKHVKFFVFFKSYYASLKDNKKITQGDFLFLFVIPLILAILNIILFKQKASSDFINSTLTVVSIYTGFLFTVLVLFADLLVKETEDTEFYNKIVLKLIDQVSYQIVISILFCLLLLLKFITLPACMSYWLEEIKILYSSFLLGFFFHYFVNILIVLYGVKRLIENKRKI